MIVSKLKSNRKKLARGLNLTKLSSWDNKINLNKQNSFYRKMWLHTALKIMKKKSSVNSHSKLEKKNFKTFP